MSDEVVKPDVAVVKVPSDLMFTLDEIVPLLVNDVACSSPSPITNVPAPLIVPALVTAPSVSLFKVKFFSDAIVIVPKLPNVSLTVTLPVVVSV